jgi:1-acyl-sn-glycerol-3-phosphate acyltransferase
MAHRRIGFWYRLAAIILRRPLMVLTRRDWSGAEHLGSGGVVVVTNHVSYFDPLVFAHFLFDNGRLPRFLAKAGMFRVFFIGSVLRGAKQIPVYRDTADAQTAYAAAVEAVNRGECVAIYPEATLTRDPDLWPMVGKSGAARIALETGAPVIPIGQWGAHNLLYPYAKKPRLFPRKKITMKVGDPVPLDDLAAVQPRTLQVINEATARIMEALTALVADLRDEKAPLERFDPRKAGLRQTGNPSKKERP